MNSQSEKKKEKPIAKKSWTILFLSFVLVMLGNLAGCSEVFSTEAAEENLSSESIDFSERIETLEIVSGEFAAELEEGSGTLLERGIEATYTIYTDLEQGSGVLFNSQGDILTSAHVVEDASYIVVKNSDGEEFNALLTGISETTDVALVRVPDLQGSKPLEVASEESTPGTAVYAIGSPENLGNTVTEGLITSTGHSFLDEYDYIGLYETDAGIGHGSSGGPLIDAETGRLLAINTLMLDDGSGIGYAIPVYTVLDMLNEWAAEPIKHEDSQVVLHGATDAYFSEELLIEFIHAFYEILPYSLNDPDIGYHNYYLLSGSSAEAEGNRLITENADDKKVYSETEVTIESVQIGEEEAEVEANAVLHYMGLQGLDSSVLTHSATFTIVIDEYGDYQITDME